MKRWISVVYGLPYVWVGIGHFINPDIFVPIVPDIIGVPFFWVYLSGVFEIVLGFGLFWHRTRVPSARMIVLMLCALSTANFNMWWNDIPFDGVRMSQMGHLIRAGVQVLLFGIAFWIGEIWPFSQRKMLSDAS